MATAPTLPADADPIADEVPIYRLVPIEQCRPVNGEWVFKSAAFDNSSCPGHTNEMSVVVGDTLAGLSRDPLDLPRHAYPDEHERWGVAVMRADCIRRVNEQTIVRTSTSRERAHGDVLGTKNGGRRQKLKKCAEWVVRPAAPVVA